MCVNITIYCPCAIFFYCVEVFLFVLFVWPRKIFREKLAPSKKHGI